MAKEKKVYAPGELDRVRNKLGAIDENEAKRMAGLLGGEVGAERFTEKEGSANKGGRIVRTARPAKKTGAALGGTSPAAMRAAARKAGAAASKARAAASAGPMDNPAVPIRLSYFERLKMDRYAAQDEFEIKSFAQTVTSTFAFFNRPPDFISSVFITKRMNQYFQKIETLVNATRTMFPKNNRALNDQIQKASVFVFSVLDAIRFWNIERIATDLARMQARPRGVVLTDFVDILKAVYKPLFILERLNTQAHIKESYKFLYRFLCIEEPMNAKEKYEELILRAVSTYETIENDIRYLLYPLLLKLLSPNWLSYEDFFSQRRNRFMAFLEVKDEDRIIPKSMEELEAEEEEFEEEAEDAGEEASEAAQESAAESAEDDALESVAGAANNADAGEKAGAAGGAGSVGATAGSAGATAGARASNDRQSFITAAQKSLDRSFSFMETLFPHAGWDKMSEFPDIYPYFRSVFRLKKDYELLAPSDAMLQVIVLTRTLQEMFFGLRYVSFSDILVSQTNERLAEALGGLINNWPNHEITFEKEYLSRLTEYCRLLESSDSTSAYTKRLYNEIQWVRKLFFFPYYRFETFSPSPIPRNSVKAVYPEIRRLRKLLTIVVSGIETGNKNGGAAVKAVCDGIDNPWDTYNFQVANPVSKRLNMLLGSKKRNNAALVSFSLMVVTILDHITNFEDSWAYPADVGALFRSVNGEGNIPQFGVDEKIDADLIFKQVIKEQQAAKQLT
jgi:hypothetical protein